MMITPLRGLNQPIRVARPNPLLRRDTSPAASLPNHPADPFRSYLLAGGLASGGLAGGLLGTGHGCWTGTGIEWNRLS